MNEHLLNERQLFCLKRKTIEKRVNEYFQLTGDIKEVLEILLVLQVREELTEDDFSLMLKGLVRHIFLKMKSSRLLRRFYIFFEEYFDSKEWKILSLKLFTIKTFVTGKLKKLQKLFSRISLEGLVGS
ncbi:hypothetical protein [Candidatus Enterococcus murrayae]|uniref:Uncharacterized protein n=1 Tax=Candidatus Enterococcus murrayae TaxID=2815321 RepID=A0ABS3HB39_9ENTE|nr:hypothetical protein [Enterococcus sp. MJM16]MBO0450669.1 hypothetical protein [Enterococcus sp. MJM16]